MPRSFNILSIFLILLCTTTTAIWIRGCFIGDDLYFRNGNSALWRINSADGQLIVSHYDGWPNPPRLHYRHYHFNAAEAVTPVFIFTGHGATHTNQHFFATSLARGTLCVVVRATGSVDWDSPAIPLLLSLASYPLTPPIRFWELSVPWGYLLIAFSVLPLGRLVFLIWTRFRRHVRIQAGRCPFCGYDVRSTPNRCAECGEWLSKKPRQTESHGDSILP